MSLGARRRRPPTPRFVANELWRRAGEVPSFHIAPARTRDARDLITGSVLGTYNSASPAWAVGPDGVLALPAANAPVIEYDPATLQCLGARIWGAVTNLCLRSEELTDAIWLASTSSMSANTVIAPTGQLTADTLTGTGAVDFIYQIITVSPSTTYTGSVFVRLGTMPAANYRVAVYNQTAGSFIAADVVVAQTPTSSGWTRISYQFTTPSGCTSIRWYPFRNTSAVTGQTVHLFGAQLNIGPLGPYVPTTTTTASSTADVWDILSLTARINNLKTLYFRCRTSASGTRGIASLNDNSSSNRLELSTSGTDPKATAVTSGSTVADLNGGTIAANTTFRLAVRLDTDSYALSINGGAVVTDTSGARAIVDRLFIGRDQAGNYMNGYIEEMAGWTKACTDAQVAALAAS